MASRTDELEASIRELEAQLPSALPEMRSILVQQIEALRSTVKLLEASLPQMEEGKRHRVALTPEIQAFFRPEPPAEVPAWVPDPMIRASVTEDLLRCPAGARVYFNDDHVSCAIPGVPGQSLSVAHGLDLRFRSDGGLAGQSFYERALLRWAIQYHLTGGRELVGFYASTEPKTYLEHGLITRWAPTGTVIAQAHWIAGKKHGWEKLWEDDGYPIVGTRYADGVQVEQVLPNAARTSS